MTFAKKICYEILYKTPKITSFARRTYQRLKTIGKNELKFSNSKSIPHPILKLL
jgi:hypothetical protein